MGTNTTWTFDYTVASIVAIVGAVIAVAVSFGLHMTQENIHSLLTLVGLVGGAIAGAGGAKSASLIHARIRVPSWWHFTPAVMVSIIGAALTLAVSYGLHVTQENIDSLLTLVGLIATGIVVGGGITSHAMIKNGVHPRFGTPPS